MTDRIRKLEDEIRARDKTIRVLCERNEHQNAENSAAYALFEQNISLEHTVAARTRQLDSKRADLERTLVELQATQVELLQGQKMRAIGQLASGIAHEINTPTQYVGSNLSFLKESFDDLLEALQSCRELVNGEGAARTPQDCSNIIDEALDRADYAFLREEIPRALAESREGVQRIGSIVSAMKEFAHPSGGNRVAVELDKLIRTTVEIARTEWKHVAELEAEFDAALPAVQVFKDELAQVLLNLIVNAAHAIGDRPVETDQTGGRIRIETRANGDWADILVRDNGCGIPAESREKIFEPFFTTKDVGRGSGQGLAIAYHIVTGKHGGELLVESLPGSGTTFTVRLPLHGTISRTEAVPAAAADGGRGS